MAVVGETISHPNYNYNYKSVTEGVTRMAPALCMMIQLSGLRDSSCRASAVARWTSGFLLLRRKLTMAAITPSLPNDIRLSPYQQQTAIASAAWRRSSSLVYAVISPQAQSAFNGNGPTVLATPFFFENHSKNMTNKILCCPIVCNWTFSSTSTVSTFIGRTCCMHFHCLV